MFRCWLSIRDKATLILSLWQPVEENHTWASRGCRGSTEIHTLEKVERSSLAFKPGS